MKFANQLFWDPTCIRKQTLVTWSAFVHRLGVASFAAYTQRLGSLMADRLSFAPQLSCTCYMQTNSVGVHSVQSHC